MGKCGEQAGPRGRWCMCSSSGMAGAAAGGLVQGSSLSVGSTSACGIQNEWKTVVQPSMNNSSGPSSCPPIPGEEPEEPTTRTVRQRPAATQTRTATGTVVRSAAHSVFVQSRRRTYQPLKGLVWFTGIRIASTVQQWPGAPSWNKVMVINATVGRPVLTASNTPQEPAPAASGAPLGNRTLANAA